MDGWMDGCMDVWTDSERENSGRRRQGDVEREREGEREREREKNTFSPSVRTVIHELQQLTCCIGFLSLELPLPPCALLVVSTHQLNMFFGHAI